MASEPEATETVARQVAEVGVLESMYSLDSNAKFKIEQEERFRALISRVEDGEEFDSVPEITFSVCISTEDDRQVKATARFVPEYPELMPPEVSCSSGDLTNEGSRSLQAAVSSYLESHVGAEVMFEFLQWLSDYCSQNGSDLFVRTPFPDCSNATGDSRRTVIPARTILRFHHIKSSKKRAHIVDWAAELNLTGVSRIGTPGVIVAEGDLDALVDYVKRLRGLNWKKMTEVRTEKIEGAEASSDSWRAFETFQELAIESAGDLLPILRERGLEHVFFEAVNLAPGPAS